ncbi:hypothetical protein Trydic_g1187 [Trypoxylus dichotomus]
MVEHNSPERGSDGTKLNINKEKIMAIAENQQQLNVQLDGIRIDQADGFEYSGVSLEEHGDEEIEVNRRV